MAQMDVQDKKWQLQIDIEAAGNVTKTLATADTYGDKKHVQKFYDTLSKLPSSELNRLVDLMLTDKEAFTFFANSFFVEA